MFPQRPVEGPGAVGGQLEVASRGAALCLRGGSVFPGRLQITEIFQAIEGGVDRPRREAGGVHDIEAEAVTRGDGVE